MMSTPIIPINEAALASSSLSSRIEALEIKASFNEDAIEQLDQVVIRQQLQIDLLIKEITDLRQSQSISTSPAERNLRDDLPPHY